MTRSNARPARSASRTADDVRALRDGLRRLVVEHGALDEACRPCGAPLSLPHAHALLELRAASGPLRVSALAQRLRIDRTNVSRLCARLERLGELERTADPADGRARALALTPRGRARAAEVDRASVAHVGRLAAALGPDLPRVLDALERLRAAMGEARATREETA